MMSRAKVTPVFLLGVPRRLIRPPTRSAAEAFCVARGVPAHLAHQVHAVFTGHSTHPGDHVVAGRVEQDMDTHGPRQFAPIGIQVARAAEGGSRRGATHTSKQPIGLQPSTKTVLTGT